jgi:hypothetical protein
MLKNLRDEQVATCVEFLATDVAISDCYDQVNKRIEGILLEAVHVFDKRVTICARHNRKMSVYHTKRQMVHVLEI